MKNEEKIGVGDLVSAKWDRDSLGLVKKTDTGGWMRKIPEYQIEWFIEPAGAQPWLGDGLSWRDKELTLRRRGTCAN